MEYTNTVESDTTSLGTLILERPIVGIGSDIDREARIKYGIHCQLGIIMISLNGLDWSHPSRCTKP